MWARAVTVRKYRGRAFKVVGRLARGMVWSTLLNQGAYVRTFPQLLKARFGEDFNQAEVGRQLGVGRSAVSNWVSGFATPGASLLPRVVEVLGIRTAEEVREVYAACSVELPAVLFEAPAEVSS